MPLVGQILTWRLVDVKKISEEGGNRTHIDGSIARWI